MFETVFPSPATNEARREDEALERRNELQMLLFQRYEARHNVAVDTSTVLQATQDTNQLFMEWSKAFSARFADRLKEHPEWLTEPLDEHLLKEVEGQLYPSH